MVTELTETLLRRALAQDAAATRGLVRALAPVVQARVARALLRRRGAARGRDVRQEVEDLSQEVFAALFDDDARVLRTWDPARGLSLANFVGLVAERQVASILRSGKRSPWTEDPTLGEELDVGPGPGPADGGAEVRVASRELLEALLDRLESELSPLGLRLFRVLLVEQRAVKDVCEEMAMSADAVYAWRSRLGKLVRRLASEIMSDSAASPRTPTRRS